MGTKLLLISQGSTFMVDAIEKNLKAVDFEVLKSSLLVKELKAHIDECDVILMYLGDYITDSKEGLVYLKDACIEQDKGISVIGDPHELDELKVFIPDSVIDHVFTRPLDIKKMIEVMQDIGSKSDKESRKKNILLADDDPTFLKMAKDWLSDDYKVTIGRSGYCISCQKYD